MFFYKNNAQNKKKVVPLTKSQKSILILDQISNTVPIFNEAISFKGKGKIDLTVFEESVNTVIQRHDALRTIIDVDKEEQIILVENKYKVDLLDGKNKDIDKLISEQIYKCYSYNEPLFRIMLIKVDNEQYYLIISAHHIIVDGWSIGVIYKEIIKVYNALIEYKTVDFKETMQFDEYIKEMEEVREKYLNIDLINNENVYMDLNINFLPISGGYEGKRYELQVDRDIMKKIKNQAKELNSTVSNLMLTLLVGMLYKVTNLKMIKIGMPVAGQNIVKGARTVVGNCVEMIGINVDMSTMQTIKDINEYINQEMTQLKHNEYIDLNNEGQSFNIVFNRNMKITDNSLGEFKMDYYPIEVTGVKYDFFCSVVEYKNEVFLRFDYNSNKLSLDIIKVWGEYYVKMLKLLEQDFETSLDKLSVFEEELQKKIITYDELKDKFRDKVNNWHINSDSHIELLILNQYGKQCGLEIQGELYIKNNEELINTNMRAKRCANNEILILGEPNQQVVVNQRNISLYIIEQYLQQMKQIHNASCEYDASLNLIKAYIQFDQPILYADEIVEDLSKYIPQYMLPNVFYKKISMDQTELIPFKDQSMGAQEKEIINILENVLKRKKIVLKDDFFNLGGNSLNAMKLVQEIEKVYSIKISISDIFKDPLIKNIVDNIVQEIAKDKHEETCRIISKCADSEYYVISGQQKSQYLLQQLNPEKTNYNIAYAVLFEGNIELKKLEESIQQIVNKHESLRTYFRECDGNIVQYIQKELDVKIEYKEESTSVDEEEYIKKAAEEFIRPFDLSCLPLFRMKLIKLKEERYLMLFDIHHIIFDGASGEIFIKELLTAYQGGEVGQLDIQYKDYAVWQKEFYKTEEMKRQEAYWLQTLQGDLPQLALRTDYKRPLKQTFSGNRISFGIGEKVTATINKMCKEHQITPYMFFLSAINIFLSKHSGQKDIIVGTPVEGRNYSLINSVIGMFVNTLPIRSKIEPEQSVIEFMKELRENTLLALNCSDIELEKIIELLHLERDISRNPLFDIMYTFQNNREVEWHASGISIKSMDINTMNSKLDLFFEVQQMRNEYFINLEYNTDLYCVDTINKFKMRFIKLIENILTCAEQKISEISLLTQKESRQLLDEFNETKVPYKSEAVLQEIFEEQVKKHPNQIAAIAQNEYISFDDINQKANRLAHYLRTLSIAADTIVAIYMERSLEMMIGILGILKAGGAYLPIATDYPLDRVQYMLKNSNTKVVLVNNEIFNIEDLDLTVVDLSKEEIHEYPSNNPVIINNPNDLAYIIYTSGTTGKPKGVMIEHSALINRLQWMQKAYPINKNDRILQKTTYTFDVSVWELIWWALEGATVVFLEPKQEKEPEKIVKTIENYGITTMHFVPSMLNAFLEYVEETKSEKSLKSLRQVFASGEALKADHVNRFNKLLYKTNGTKLINLYGPTEATIDVTYFNCFTEKEIELVPIGKPIDNIKLYILDEQHKLVPVGVSGELYISGVGVARGYLNNEELTAERFIDNPFEIDTKMYKTGDLVRWLPDGNIEYLGRLDHQVKIRGFRIELGEIEKALLELEGIRQAIVIIKERGENKFLIAYYTGSKKYDTLAIKNHLKNSLPEYMVPSYIILIDKIPTTHNGKLNTKMLPEPEDILEDEGFYVAATTEQEKLIEKIWCDVLGIKKIGIEDDFFSLGGDSIKAIQICSRLSSKGAKCTVKDIFEQKTIKKLVEYVVFDVRENKNIEEAVEGEVLLAPIQKWFFEQHFEVENHWNQSIMLRTSTLIDIQVLEKAFLEVVKHHNALRMNYRKTSNQVVQYCRSNDEKIFEIVSRDYCGYKEAKLLIQEESKRIQEEISLDEQLIKLVLFNTDAGDYILIVIHHLIIDGISWRIILEDLINFYQSILENKSITLPRKTNSYSEWVSGLYNYTQSKMLREELNYWEDISYKISKVKPFMSVLITSDNISNNKKVDFKLDFKETQMLLQNVNRAYHTEINDILITALALAIQEWNGGDSVAISLEGHGREEIIDTIDITRTIGWFTSKYPVVLELSKEADLGYYIKHVKDTLRKVPNKGIGYGILKYLAGEEKTLNNIPQLSFNYLGDLENIISNELFEEVYIETEGNVNEANHKVYDIDINAYIMHGRFCVEIQYRVDRYFESSIKALADIFEKKLLELINLCADKEIVELTASDYDDILLSLDELEDIKAQISELI